MEIIGKIYPQRLNSNIKDDDLEMINDRIKFIEYLWSDNFNQKYRYILESKFLENYINDRNIENYHFYIDGALNNFTLEGGVIRYC